MLAWLAANAATIIISAILLIIVAVLVRSMVLGKTGCGGDCAECMGSCSSEKTSIPEAADGSESACGSGCYSCPHSGNCRTN